MIIFLVYFGNSELINNDGSTVFGLLGLAPGLEEDHMHVGAAVHRCRQIGCSKRCMTHILKCGVLWFFLKVTDLILFFPHLPQLIKSLLFRTNQRFLLYQVNDGFWVRWPIPLNFRLFYELPP